MKFLCPSRLKYEHVRTKQLVVFVMWNKSRGNLSSKKNISPKERELCQASNEDKKHSMRTMPLNFSFSPFKTCIPCKPANKHNQPLFTIKFHFPCHPTIYHTELAWAWTHGQHLYSLGAFKLATWCRFVSSRHLAEEVQKRANPAYRLLVSFKQSGFVKVTYCCALSDINQSRFIIVLLDCQLYRLHQGLLSGQSQSQSQEAASWLIATLSCCHCLVNGCYFCLTCFACYALP